MFYKENIVSHWAAAKNFEFIYSFEMLQKSSKVSFNISNHQDSFLWWDCHFFNGFYSFGEVQMEMT